MKSSVSWSITWSAPIARTWSAFEARHTPVTSAPMAFASCTAKPPTPPDAPLTRRCDPGPSSTSRSPCSAVVPETTTAAACTASTEAGRVATNRSGTATSSAKPPWSDSAYTASPTRIPRDGRADGRDLARDIPPDHRLARAAQAERETTDARLAAHDEHVAHADGHGGAPG